MPALSLTNSGDWEDADVVSGTSLVRLDNRTFVYADNGGATLKKVDVAAPTVVLSTAGVGYTVAVIKGSKEGNVAIIAGDMPSSEVIGRKVNVYNSDLTLLQRFTFGDTTQATADDEGNYEFGTLFSELNGAALAVGDKYAAAIWVDNNETWTAPGARSGSKGDLCRHLRLCGQQFEKLQNNPGDRYAG